jgi:hypothetical protein
MGQLERFQLQGDTVWPDGALYRVKTIHGDDFFVDAEETRIVIENSLGVFEPTLAECVTVTPFRGRRATEADSKHRFPVLESRPTEPGGPGVNHELANANDDWRIVLSSGTVLIGPMKGDEIDFKLPMGPDHLMVKRSVLVSMQQEIWYDDDDEAVPVMAEVMVQPVAVAPIADSGIAHAANSPEPKPPTQPVYRRAPAQPKVSLWYDRSDMEAQKR